jgi:hypothetical protein
VNFPKSDFEKYSISSNLLIPPDNHKIEMIKIPFTAYADDDILRKILRLMNENVDNNKDD